MQSIKKRMRQEGIGFEDSSMGHMPPIIEKTYATKNCGWCPYDFDKFEIVCPQCHNCQYCGLFSSTNTVCKRCGNTLPAELKDDQPIVKKKIRFL
jgi:hypothetical protein